jgi:hypothetical protein
MTWIYLFRKYAVWLSINLYVLGITTWLSGMRLGVLKYACGQRESHSMLINLKLIFSPWSPTLTAAATVLVWLSFTAMNLDIKYGARAWSTLHEKLIQTKGYIWLPLAAAACWFIFREELATLLSLLSWVAFIGFLASCSLLLMKTRKA